MKEKMKLLTCMLNILDSLKLYDNNSLFLDDETLSELMFRKMKAYDIDLNKELGLTHLKPVTRKMKAYGIDLNKELGLTHLKPVTKKDSIKNKDENTVCLLPHKELIEKIITDDYYKTYGTNGTESSKNERITGAKLIVSWMVNN